MTRPTSRTFCSGLVGSLTGLHSLNFALGAFSASRPTALSAGLCLEPFNGGLMGFKSVWTGKRTENFGGLRYG